jgi:peroxiredoxin
LKINLLIIGLLTVFLSSFGQDAKDILKKSYDKCQSVQNGNYEMIIYQKYAGYKDTLQVSFNTAFKKLKDDSLYASAFHYKIFWKGKCTGDVLYTGNDFVRINAKDSTAIIMSKKLWAKKILSFNNTFYSPLVNRESFPLPHGADFIDKNYVFKYIGEENINNLPCYHIQVNKIQVKNGTEAMKILRIEYHYWTTKADFIPVQYSTVYNTVTDKDTMCDYQKVVLNKYELDNLKDEKILTLNSIPTYYTIKDFIPDKTPDLLAKNTVAPNWELLSLTDEKINLNGLKGQLVLIDFFYKSCYPCVLSLPGLQALHEKYKARGLRIIGVDIYDKKEDDMASFLAKHYVTYTVLFGGENVATDYNVSACPTMYLIDKNGKVIFSRVGYSKDMEKAIEKIIKKSLSN